MAIDKVKQYFKQYKLEDKIIEFDESSATVELAAKALHTEGKRIIKNQSYRIKDRFIIIILVGYAKISNSKYKSFFHEKAHMLKFDEVESIIGHPPGGVCPFAINDGIDVYLDESLKRFKTVFPACGSTNSAIELTIEELEKYSNYKEWIDVGEY